MIINKTLNGSALILAPEGRLDTTTAPELEAVLRDSLAGVENLTFDLEKLEYISSAGLRVLLSAQKIMNKQGSMKLLHVSDMIMEIFEVTGFSVLLTIELVSRRAGQEGVFTPRRFFRSYKGVLALSFIAYSAAYLCRLNISPALPGIQQELGLADSQLGAITGAFFWVYALGQLFNGWLGCRVPARFMVGTGLLGSAACNFAFQLIGNAGAMIIIWGVNGIFQSMLWGPLMKSISNWCEPHKLPTASFVMAVSCIVGNALANGFSGFMSVRVSWQVCFLVPAVVAALVGVLMLFALNGEPRGREPGQAAGTDQPAAPPKLELPFFRFLLLSHLPLLLLLAISNGCIKDGFSVWFPKILNDSGLIAPGNSWLLLVVLPVINFLAVCAMNLVRKKLSLSCEALLTGLLLLTAGAALSLFLLPTDATGVFLALMIVMSVLTAAANPVLTSYVPFLYARFRYVSIVAGSIDFSIYLGSALSGYVIGGIGDRSETVGQAVHGISVFWLAAALLSTAIGLVLCGLLIRRRNRHMDDGRAFS